MLNIESFVMIVLSYLIGSLSCAVIICKIMRLPDPRTQGSHNPGATNVLRFGGKKAAVLTLLGDTLKGVIPVLFAKWLGLSDAVLAAVAFAAFIGHLYPIFFRFQGGKGVATAFGVLIALNWQAGLVLAAVWLTVVIVFRYSSLGALIAAITAPFIMWYFSTLPIVVATILMAVMLIYRHRSNLFNLVSGKEDKLELK